jgi:hypothetical protein
MFQAFLRYQRCFFLFSWYSQWKITAGEARRLPMALLLHREPPCFQGGDRAAELPSCGADDTVLVCCWTWPMASSLITTVFKDGDFS